MGDVQQITLVLARADNGVIGCDGKLPWHLPADLKRFKALTMGKPMVMGRKTFNSLPGLLPGRRHIVLTRDTDWHAKGAETVVSVEEAIALAQAPEIMVIGGAEIYYLFLPQADRIALTEVHVVANGDTLVAPFGHDWHETARQSHAAEGLHPAYSFVALTRR